MNNIEERIENLKANIALSELIGPDELTVTVSDLSALIAQLEAAQKENGELVMSLNVANGATGIWKDRAEKEEAELSAANEKLSKPVELSSYWIEPASVWNDDEPTMPVDEVIKAIKAAGFTVEGNADAE
ncbi:TPA: hypothetical protein ACQ340_003845 [Yersinia enterocolitica]